MPDTNITLVSVTFGNGVKREEYGPVKKAEVTVIASVGEGESGQAALDEISNIALAKVAALLSAPKPETVIQQRSHLGETEQFKAEAQQWSDDNAKVSKPGEAPARRPRGPNKAKTTEIPGTGEQKPDDTLSEEIPPAADEWAAGAEDIVITDAELLSATSKRAGELGAREPIINLIRTYSTRPDTQAPPFKVQEIPQNQRKDYLEKLAALTA